MIVNIKRALRRGPLWICVWAGTGAVSTLVFRLLRPYWLGSGGFVCAVGIAILVGLAYVAIAQTVVERAPERWRSHKEAMERTHTLIALAEIAPPASTIWPQPHH